MGWLLKKEGFVCQENLSTCNNSWRTVLSFRLPLSLQCVFDNKLTHFISGNGFVCNVMDSYFSLLNLSFVENCHISIFTKFAKQSMINRLSNAINHNRLAARFWALSPTHSTGPQKLFLQKSQYQSLKSKKNSKNLVHLFSNFDSGRTLPTSQLVRNPFQSVFFLSVFFQSVSIQSVFLRNVHNLRVF